MTLPDRIAQARKLLEGITPGKWMSDHDDSAITCSGNALVSIQTLARVYWDEGRQPTENRANAKLIAAAPQLVRDLLAEIDRLQPYLQHRPECDKVPFFYQHQVNGRVCDLHQPKKPCSCGLSSLRDGQPA